VADEMLQQFPTELYPHLAETITAYVTPSGYDYATEFQYGLDQDPYPPIAETSPLLLRCGLARCVR
jgi:hypothetical protein